MELGGEERLVVYYPDTFLRKAKRRILTQILATKMGAIIRLSQSEYVYAAAEALLAGGISCIELTRSTYSATPALTYTKQSRQEGKIFPYFFLFVP